jgi:hypothetical protein
MTQEELENLSLGDVVLSPFGDEATVEEIDTHYSKVVLVVDDAQIPVSMDGLLSHWEAA